MFAVFAHKVYLFVLDTLIRLRIGNHERLAWKAQDTYDWLYIEQFVRYCAKNNIPY